MFAPQMAAAGLQAFRRSGRNTHFYQLLGIKYQKIRHMPYISHMEVRFINLVTKLGNFPEVSIAGVGGPEAWYAWRCAPHHPTLWPRDPGSWILGSHGCHKLGHFWGIFPIRNAWHMPDISQPSHVWPTTCAPSLPSAMGAANSCVPPHTQVVCPI